MHHTPLARHHPYAYCDVKSNSTEQKLCQYTRPELRQLQQKNLSLLSNNAMVNTLPDKGAKLKEINAIIDRLLLDRRTISASDEITPDNTDTLDCPLTKKLDEMTVLTSHQGARKRSVDLANQQAYHHSPSNSLLVKRSQPRPSLSVFQHYIQSEQPLSDGQDKNASAKVRMLSLDESMTLQQQQQLSVQQVKKKNAYRQSFLSLFYSLSDPWIIGAQVSNY
ncbi:hypothetical protein BD560DRAFT_385234 [Blakeslea trispora]|nr:hypothetical protein BD560DRAFT_385234 [Blakeslea trispora]